MVEDELRFFLPSTKLSCILENRYFCQNEILWTCMAVIATDNKELDAAEEAYAAIGRYDKVDYIRYIKVSVHALNLVDQCKLIKDQCKFV